jgi:hypothetical protein
MIIDKRPVEYCLYLTTDMRGSWFVTDSQGHTSVAYSTEEDARTAYDSNRVAWSIVSADSRT